MGWRASFGDWTGGTILVAVSLGCAGAAPPEPGCGTRVRIVTEIEPAEVVNRRPRFISVAPRQAREGEPYRYSAAALDPEGDAVRFTLVRAPEGSSLEGGLLRWQPNHAQAGHRQRFTLRAVDAHGAARDQSWSVLPVPEDPGPRPAPIHHR